MHDTSYAKEQQTEVLLILYHNHRIGQLTYKTLFVDNKKLSLKKLW